MFCIEPFTRQCLSLGIIKRDNRGNLISHQEINLETSVSLFCCKKERKVGGNHFSTHCCHHHFHFDRFGEKSSTYQTFLKLCCHEIEIGRHIKPVRQTSNSLIFILKALQRTWVLLRRIPIQGRQVQKRLVNRHENVPNASAQFSVDCVLPHRPLTVLQIITQPKIPVASHAKLPLNSMNVC